MSRPRAKAAPSGPVELPANGWTPRHYQVDPWNYMMNTPWGARLILCHHRRAGKDHFSINWTAVASQMRVGTYIHVLPYANQGRRIIWEGIDFNGKKFLDAFPESLIKRKSDLEMRLTLTNGSVYQVLGADDPDKLVGINAIGAIFSEYALQDPKAWKLVMPMLNENGGWAIFPTTPRGKNHFHDLVHGNEETGQVGAIKNPKWHVSIETVETTGAVSPDEVEEARRDGMEEPLVQQEFYCSFNAGLQGAYYERQIAAIEAVGRIHPKVIFDPSLEVHTAWDLGLDDATTIWFFQEAHDGVRFIHYIEDQDKPLSHYIRECNTLAAKFDWVYGKHFAPHDIRQREMTTGNTRLETARSMGMRFTPLDRDSQADGIEASRQLIARSWFNSQACMKGVIALKSYRKQWDEKLKVYRDKPLHDKYSHGADAFRTAAMALRRHGSVRRDANKGKPQNVESSYDAFKW